MDVSFPHTAWFRQKTLLVVHPLALGTHAIGNYDVFALRLIERPEQLGNVGGPRGRGRKRENRSRGRRAIADNPVASPGTRVWRRSPLKRAGAYGFDSRILCTSHRSRCLSVSGVRRGAGDRDRDRTAARPYGCTCRRAGGGKQWRPGLFPMSLFARLLLLLVLLPAVSLAVVFALLRRNAARLEHNLEAENRSAGRRASDEGARPAGDGA